MNRLKGILIISTLLIVFGLLQKTNWQYYYYDSWTTTYPYQQWCSEQLYVRINSQSKNIKAGRFHTVLDLNKFIYETSSDAVTLRNNLFDAANETFINWTSILSPSWKIWSTNTILEIDRSNTTTNYNWSNWLYWIIKFIPIYNTSAFNWSFGMEFDPVVDWCNSAATIETTLSLDWCDIINLSQQNTRLTWTYQVLQEPCITDTNPPSISISNPIEWWDKQSSLNWISLSLSEAVWVASSNVPYIWTGWHTIWTWNPWWSVSNQYWINLNSFNLTINSVAQSQTFTW
jgi:hypothetical protein